jgi:putative DNA primase/helicase
MNDEPAAGETHVPGSEAPRKRTPEEILAEGRRIAEQAHAALETIEDRGIADIIGSQPDGTRAERPSEGDAFALAEERKKAKPRRRRQKAMLVDLAVGCTLWRTPSGVAIITLPEGGHFENWLVRSQFVRLWLSGLAYKQLGIAPSTQALEDAIRVFEARARSEGKVRESWLRIGSRANRLYIDLCDDNWRAIEIGPGGFNLVASEGFVRTPRQRAQCEPEEGYSIDEFRRFANVETDDDFVLLVGCIIGFLRGRGPYPGLFIHGEHGSGKTLLLRFISDLVDPAAPPTQGPPREERDLIASAQNRHLLALDNFSHIDATLSDAICRLLSGSGFAARALHTDKDENTFDGARPIVVNGITALADRADLNDRAVIIRLASIPETRRKAEDEIETDWKAAQPRILGAICTALAAALRNIDGIRLDRVGRMADFEKWAAAAEPGLGWDAGTFATAYRRNRRDSSETVFEGDLVAVAIRDFVESGEIYWEGSATELLARLNGIVSESTKTLRTWPKSNQALGNAIARSTPLLRARGISVEKRHSGDRKIVIARTAGAP